MKTPNEIINEMMNDDAFSRLLGMKVIQLTEGQCSIQLAVEGNFLNGMGIAHGGLAYSLADTCLAFAANSYGRKALSVETSISHLKKIKKDDILIAESELVSKGNNIGVFLIHVKNQFTESVALFKGHVFFSNEIW